MCLHANQGTAGLPGPIGIDGVPGLAGDTGEKVGSCGRVVHQDHGCSRWLLKRRCCVALTETYFLFSPLRVKQELGYKECKASAE